MNKTTRAVLGIDLGTSQLKALLSTPDGEVLGRGRAAYPVIVPAEGHAETDPEDWWRAARTAVREAVANTAGSGTTATSMTGGAGTEIVGVAVTGQMHGVVLAADDGRPLRSAILWLDRRASAEAAYYGELPGRLTAPRPVSVSRLTALPRASRTAALAASHQPSGSVSARPSAGTMTG